MTWDGRNLLFSDTTHDSDIDNDNDTCGANSFQLRDTVCDDSSNTPICLYDGGDCCLEFKNTELCKNCSCVLDVDLDQMLWQFEDLNIMPIANPEDLDPEIEECWTTIEVDDVMSSQVCAMLCLDHYKASQINAWQYQERDQLCKCGWIVSMACPETLVSSNWTLDNSSLSNTALGTNVFVKLEMTVPCGKPFGV